MSESPTAFCGVSPVNVILLVPAPSLMTWPGELDQLYVQWTRPARDAFAPVSKQTNAAPYSAVAFIRDAPFPSVGGRPVMRPVLRFVPCGDGQPREFVK